MTAAESAPIGEGHNRPAFDVERVRRDFPVLQREVYGKPLVYLDSGASAQKPQVVIDTMRQVMEEEYANIHRGVHYLSQLATQRYDAVRGKVARFLNAAREEEIVFTHGATEAINLVAASWGRSFLSEGDEVVISCMEHHANIVPWQLLREEKGIVVRVVPMDDDGNFLLDAFEEMLGPRTKLVSVAHVSNVLGTVLPVQEIIRLAHGRGIPVLLDGCQGITHMPVDVQDLDCDFYVFAPHKLYGPGGVGVLYGKYGILERMPPYQGGGDMIASVSFEKTTYQAPPFRFEAGTPAIPETIALGTTIDYLTDLGMANIAAHEAEVLAYAHERLARVPGFTMYGRAAEKSSIVSFTLDDVHAHDVGTIIDRAGVALRVGHHCAQPLMDRLGVVATARASLGLYNTKQQNDGLAVALERGREIL
ncbi:MAG: cysteine desulfurase, partial [Alphaproteobacteria bacterium]|nr:cysteine desulfurase [Alphaproteobacteria bacterium]